MASKTAAKPAAKKAAPAAPKSVERVSLITADAHAVLYLDGSEYRLEGPAIAQLRREFDLAHSVVNPGL
jgi:hypothetical protein